MLLQSYGYLSSYLNIHNLQSLSFHIFLKHKYKIDSHVHQ